MNGSYNSEDLFTSICRQNGMSPHSSIFKSCYVLWLPAWWALWLPWWPPAGCSNALMYQLIFTMNFCYCFIVVFCWKYNLLLLLYIQKYSTSLSKKALLINFISVVDQGSYLISDIPLHAFNKSNIDYIMRLKSLGIPWCISDPIPHQLEWIEDHVQGPVCVCTQPMRYDIAL